MIPDPRAVLGEHADRAQHGKGLIGAAASGVATSHRAKRWRNRAILAPKVARTARAVGAKPKSSVAATRRLARSHSPTAVTPPRFNMSLESSPLIAASSMTTSGTVRAIGPSTRSPDAPIPRLSSGTNPGVGRKPTTPQKAAGLRSEPPVSEPVASGVMPRARRRIRLTNPRRKEPG